MRRGFDKRSAAGADDRRFAGGSGQPNRGRHANDTPETERAIPEPPEAIASPIEAEASLPRASEAEDAAPEAEAAAPDKQPKQSEQLEPKSESEQPDEDEFDEEAEAATWPELSPSASRRRRSIGSIRRNARRLRAIILI